MLTMNLISSVGNFEHVQPKENTCFNEGTRHVESNHQRPKGGKGPRILNVRGKKDSASEVKDNLEQVHLVDE